MVCQTVIIRPEVGLSKTGRLVPQAMNHHAALLHGYAIGMIPGTKCRYLIKYNNIVLNPWSMIENNTPGQLVVRSD
jgi:hypothetical protein